MFTFRRNEASEPPVEWAGQTLRLVSEQWAGTAKMTSVSFGGTYRRPLRVETGDMTIPIRDHVMLARVVMAALVILTVLVGRILK